ncbi:hypothetical protein Vadar_013030 [Vaccinium darrowii]|uniref:Uncharacterized protein n=1 Tax=Vaccinium darrowii TaxID=229202 RepID=A0ACB7YEE0_9ERIC|nr:hypothetical protein Vadar_013030 [Vaccinium darrowii]
MQQTTASVEAWVASLILFQEWVLCTFFPQSIFKGKNDIPFIDVNELCFHVFDISAPPTSLDCVVFMVCHKAFCRIKISTCQRGESMWTTIVPTGYSDIAHVVNTVFVNGIWYCFHNSGCFGAFDMVNSRYRFFGLPEGLKWFPESNLVSYVVKRGDDQVYLCIHGVAFSKVFSKEPLKVAVDPMSDADWQLDVEHLIRIEPEKAFIQFQNELQVDSFNLPAWCGAFDATENNNGGTIAFRWHCFRSCINNYFELDGRNCLKQNKGCRTIVVWIEPVWVYPSPALSWMS